MKEAVAGELAAAYYSRSSMTFALPIFVPPGRLIIHLAREFGFCYGVDRAVDYAHRRGAASRSTTSS
jgi:hypothetical protein